MCQALHERMQGIKTGIGPPNPQETSDMGSIVHESMNDTSCKGPNKIPWKDKLKKREILVGSRLGEALSGKVESELGFDSWIGISGRR